MAQFLDLSTIKVHHMIADKERVAVCLGIRDASTGELTELIEQCTLRNGKVVELKLFYHDPGSMVGKPRAV